MKNTTCLPILRPTPPGIVVKERTSVVSTPSLAELYRFAMNFLLVRKRKKKRNRDGKKREVKREGQSEETAHMDDYVDGRKCNTQT